jgi:hypothetical protein
VTALIARDVHHAASVCRRFYWSELCAWPEHLPHQRTLVVVSDADELVPVQVRLWLNAADAAVFEVDLWNSILD